MSDENSISLETVINYVNKLTGIKNPVVEEHAPPPRTFDLVPNLEMENLENISSYFADCFGSHLHQVFRCGIKHVYHNRRETFNISFIMALLTLIDDSFINYMDNKKIVIANQFYEKIKNDISSCDLYEKYGYKEMKIKKSEFKKIFSSFNDNNILIHFLCEYLSINIFIFDIENNKARVSYSDPKFNKFKMNIMMTKYKNCYEPLIFSDTKLLKYNSPLIENMLTTTFSKLKTMQICKSDERTFVVGQENLDKYIEHKPEEIENDEDSDKDSIDTETKSIVKENNFDELIDTEVEDSDSIIVNDKMTIKQLQKLANDHDISITNGTFKNGNPKMKTKKALYTELLNL